MYVKLKVIGRVQGVFFRVSTRDKAKELELRGWVRNVSDGSVELEASGPKEQLDLLVAWCRKGPSSARVDDLNVEWVEEEIEFESGNNFEIR